MARLSKTHKYSILWLNSQGSSIDDICKELKVSAKQVRSVIDTNNTSISTTDNISPISKTAKDFMIRHTQNNVNNVSIMTPQASMMADEARKSLPSNTTQTSPFYIKKP